MMSTLPDLVAWLRADHSSCSAPSPAPRLGAVCARSPPSVPSTLPSFQLATGMRRLKPTVSFPGSTVFGGAASAGSASAAVAIIAPAQRTLRTSPPMRPVFANPVILLSLLVDQSIHLDCRPSRKPSPSPVALRKLPLQPPHDERQRITHGE